MNNKKIILIITALLLLIPVSFAQLKLEDIRVYVNAERYSDIDESGGDVSVNRDDVLMLKILLDNDWSNTTYFRLKAQLRFIDNGDDLTDWKPSSTGWYDIDANDKVSKSISFSIPNDADYDEYYLDLTLYYNHTNGTEGKWEYSWDVTVKKEEGAEEAGTSLDDIKTMIQNVNCSNQFNEGEEYYQHYLSCFSNLTVCSAYKDTNQNYKSDYDSCIAVRDSLDSVNRRCEADHYLLNKTYYDCVISRDNYGSQRVMLPFLIAIASIGGTWLYLKKGGEWRRRGKMATDRDMTSSPDTRPSIDDLKEKSFKERIKERIIPQKAATPDIRDLDNRGNQIG
jgi:hypothetical protein